MSDEEKRKRIKDSLTELKELLREISEPPEEQKAPLKMVG